MLSSFFLLFFPFLSSFLLSFPPRSIDLRQETQSEKHSIPISIVSRFFSSFYSPCIRSSFFFYICSGQPRFASTRKNLLVLQRERGIKDWYLLYIYVKSYFSREIRGLRISCFYLLLLLLLLFLFSSFNCTFAITDALKYSILFRQIRFQYSIDLLISLFQLLDEDYSVIDILNVLHKSFFAFNLSSRNFELSIDTLNAVDRLLATKY